MKSGHRYISSKKNADAFTLIELLTVISIIALLMAILMPSLQRVRQVGQMVVCLSNEKQLGLGLMVYAQTYDGWLGVNNFDHSDYPHQTSWNRQILAASVLAGVEKTDGSPRYWLADIENPIPIFVCPAAKRLSHYDSGEPGHPHPQTISYLMNDMFRSNGQADYSFLPGRNRVENISNPSRVYLLYEPESMWYYGWNSEFPRCDFRSYSTSVEDFILARHHPKESVNFTFGDGHAEKLQFEEIDYSDGYKITGRWRSKGR